MHNHNDNDRGMGGMMWMMLICCAVALLLVLFAGTGLGAAGTSSWWVFGAVALMLVAHYFMMKKMHGGHGEGHSASANKDPVCGMSVKEGGLTAEYAGKTYHFCSAYCQKEFNAHPEEYVR